MVGSATGTDSWRAEPPSLIQHMTVSYPTRSAAAVEITAAAAPESVELWKLMNHHQGGRWHVEGLRGGWVLKGDWRMPGLGRSPLR